MTTTQSNDIPPVSQLINPTLAALHFLGGSANSNEITDKIVDDLNLSSDATTRVYKDSARPILQRYLVSARTILKSNGLIENSERGVWRLTPLGLRTKSVNAYEARANYRKWRMSRIANGEDEKGSDPDGDDDATDDSEEWRDSLLNNLRNMHPSKFEMLCQLLLRESGFTEVEVTGKPGDGGIDGRGIIRLHDLISFSVVFQCKRYSGSVPASQMREFRGAMGPTDKGLFITTGTFTKGAQDEAQKPHSAIIDLIDGESLVELLKSRGIGVEKRVEVDSAFFETF